MNGSSFQQVLRQNLGWFLSKHSKTLLLRDFILKPTERAQVLLKIFTRDFQNSPPFERLACLYVTITENLSVFKTLSLKQIFWKKKTFFKKLEYRFLVESSNIENALFPYKIAISEANVKTNKMVTTKWTYQKERSFASNYFIFLKILFQYKNLLQRVDLLCQRPKCPYLYFL